MSRRAKNWDIKRPTLTQEFFKYEYECPACKKKVEREFSMVRPAIASVKTTNSYWCKNVRCGATHCVTYRLFKKRNGEPKIKIYAFTSNGEAYVKRFRLLEPTTKGEKEHE